MKGKEPSKLCKITAYEVNGHIIWRDYFGNVWPIAVPEVQDGDILEVYVVRP